MTNTYNFCSQPKCTDGDSPVAGLAPSSDGNFYGTTSGGGANDNNNCLWGCGTVFKINPAGKLTTLYSFCEQSSCTDGEGPQAPVVEGSDGNFYGTTEAGGAKGLGTVFKMTRSGVLTTLYSFCSKANCADGSLPSGPLVQGTDGNLYGTTVRGGTDCGLNGCGTVFRITPRGQLTTLYGFCPEVGCTDGWLPTTGLVQATDGNLYGTTLLGGISNCGGYNFGCGTDYKITPKGALTTLHAFDGTDGDEPSGLTQSTDGNFYGTTSTGEGPAWYGTVFSISMGLDPFVTFVRNAGNRKQIGGILGQGFTGTTGVFLNGTPASFTVVSDTYIQATVPPGATTGFVTVETPSGTLRSNVPFYVIR